MFQKTPSIYFQKLELRNIKIIISNAYFRNLIEYKWIKIYLNSKYVIKLGKTLSLHCIHIYMSQAKSTPYTERVIKKT